MTDAPGTSRLDRVTTLGLTVPDEAAPQDVPSPLRALKTVVGYEVRPTATVPLSRPDALREVDRLWLLHAEQNGLFDVDGSFLLGLFGAEAGPTRSRWAVLRWLPGTGLASALAEPHQGLDFLAMSPDGRVVCAVNEEEYDYWIIVTHMATTGPERWQVAPVPVGARVDAALARRMTAGARAVGASYVRRQGSRLRADLLSLDADAGAGTGAGAGPEGAHPPCLLSTPDEQGTIRFTEPGYALVEGTARFMAAAVPEGVDEARARFARYARALAHRHPHLTAVAAVHPVTHHAWSRAAAVTSGTATARHLSLLTDFTSGTLAAADFADAWHRTRRAAKAAGERVDGELAALLHRVFMTLEDYTPDPSLREPGDLTDAQLRDSLRQIFRP
ncbi:colicin immunity domain-containing protein [Streptomyces sp. NPDC048718]|uniref:colicin immunity domain-containing protein n=1 Tax=Streptomyces sp. NPDC048718 TaxID=3365587 RepID=UPI0037178D1A